MTRLCRCGNPTHATECRGCRLAARFYGAGLGSAITRLGPLLMCPPAVREGLVSNA